MKVLEFVLGMHVLSDREMEEYLRDMDGAVLYDVFYEAGTMLSGVMIAIEREYRRIGDEEKADKIRDDDLSVIKMRASIDPYDIDKQISCKIAWSKRTQEMQKLLDRLRGSK